MYTFKNIEYFPDLINSEGTILSIVEQEFESQDGINSRLWIKGLISSNEKVYAKVNETALLWFFKGRISVKELFLIRNDEIYVLEQRLHDEIIFTEHNYSVDFDDSKLSQLVCANFHFHSISEGMRLQNPNEEIMKNLELYWLNSHEYQKANYR